ncbi:endonuclease/exonuclease/phosphatase [Anaerotruncus sp. CAG:390]|nr:endonuclease/exonuclease/phosphatase [Anaerotruncus sp. CAG:390]
MDYSKRSDIRIMSHNIWCGEVHNRDLHLAEIYFRHAPDVLALQEMTQNLYDSRLLSLLEEKYELLKPDTQGLLDNTPLLVRRGVFDVVKCGWHIYDGLNNHKSKSLAWALLRKTDDGSEIGVISTHYWWQAGPESDLARVYDAKQLTAYAHFMQVEYGVPVVAMGDLNMRIGAPGYIEMTSTGAMDMRMAAVEYASRSNTHHPYAVYNPESGEYENGPMPKGSHLNAIDHMFVYGHEQLDVRVFNVVTEQEALDVSDHCPIYVDCKILPRPERPVSPTFIKKEQAVKA